MLTNVNINNGLLGVLIKGGEGFRASHPRGVSGYAFEGSL